MPQWRLSLGSHRFDPKRLYYDDYSLKGRRGNFLKNRGDLGRPKIKDLLQRRSKIDKEYQYSHPSTNTPAFICSSTPKYQYSHIHAYFSQEWGQHLLQYYDGQFLDDSLFGLSLYNVIQQHTNNKEGNFFFNSDRFIGKDPPTVEQLKRQLENKNNFFYAC
jgi:hypothetical protein